MDERIAASRSDPTIKAIISAAFPEYRGRKIYLVPCTAPLDVRSWWDGGTRSYFTFVNLSTMRQSRLALSSPESPEVAPPTLPVPAQHPVFDKQIPGAGSVELRPGFVCVEHVIFCGHDLGLRIHAHPDNLAKLLQEAK